MLLTTFPLEWLARNRSDKQAEDQFRVRTVSCGEGIVRMRLDCRIAMLLYR